MEVEGVLAIIVRRETATDALNRQLNIALITAPITTVITLIVGLSTKMISALTLVEELVSPITKSEYTVCIFQSISSFSTKLNYNFKLGVLGTEGYPLSSVSS